MTNAGSRRVTVILIAIAILLVGYFLVGGAVYYWKERVPHDEAGAISSLSALHTMENNYKDEHGSFAASFAQLGIPLGAKLSGDVLTWNGSYCYRIVHVIYNSADKATDYQIDSRPSKYQYGSKHSYLMESTGAVHFTVDRRDATGKDPVIQLPK